MIKAVFITVAAMLVLACPGLAEDAATPAGAQNRIMPIDDGTILLKNMDNDMIMFTDIDDHGSRLRESDYESPEENLSIGYLLFDLSDLMPVADQNLVMLKIYADNSSQLDEELMIASDRLLSIQDGTSLSGFLTSTGHDMEVTTGPGFALFNLTAEIKTLQQHEQKTIGIFFAGEDLSIGTMESGNPAEMIVL
ncbi:MAG: hypothetical protein JW999_08245 [Methanotrichaceae archaeon]|nr:hypothetical protein [Methanotrichaceae archaeon]